MVVRILAIDYGRRRVGLAVSDPLGVTAHGLDTLHRKNIRSDMEHLRQVISEREVGLILIGNPLHMSGERSEMSEEAEAFAIRLSQESGIPYRMWDERLTSMEAERRLKEMGQDPRRHKSVDRLAAQILLNSFLLAQP